MGISLDAMQPAMATADLQTMLEAPSITFDNIDLQRDDLNAFYTKRNDKTVWNFVGPENIIALNNFLASVEQVIKYHGLQESHYPIDLMRKLASSSDDDARMKLELLVTDTLLRLSHELHGDENDLDDLYVGWNFHRNKIDIPSELAVAVATNNLGDYINSLAPHKSPYEALAKALQTYRDMQAKGNWPTIDPGPKLIPKDNSPRISQLRARLAAEGYVTTSDHVTDNNLYDDDLLKTIMMWQSRNGLEADGHIGKDTLATLNLPIQSRIETIEANMERWRHMPDDFPPGRGTVVNIANASIEISEMDKVIYRGPVVVGKVDRKTPFIDSNIRSMIINPSWHVPAKIAAKDILPKLRKDPHYLEKLGFVIKGDVDDPHGEKIDWDRIRESEFNFRLRQSPGDMNSLGRLKFDFDNDFAVYMHGTPHQELFKKTQRDFSSGCIRLRDPEQVGELLLANNDGAWTVQKIEDEIAKDKTRWIGLTKPMPLAVVYWTAFTDETGSLNFRKDVYDYDQVVLADPTQQNEQAPALPEAKPN
jgi:murein L,D-transpeptidase YcbB/YkuD